MPADSLYDQECKRTCEWCAKGIGFTSDFGDGSKRHGSVTMTTPCTALPRDEWGELEARERLRLEAELAEARKDVHRMEYLYGHDEGPSAWDAYRFISTSSTVDEARALIDANEAATKVEGKG